MNFSNRMVGFTLIIYWSGVLLASFLPIENNKGNLLAIGVIGLILALASPRIFKRFK